MSFVPTLGVKFTPNCKAIRLYDTTGLGSVQNPTGYSYNGNPATSDFVTVTVTITLPDGTAIAPINVFPTLPNTNGIYFEVTNAMLGLGANPIPSGAWYFDYYLITQTDNGFHDKGFKFLACAEKCCRDTAAAQVKSEDCHCKNTKLELFSDIWDMYEAMMSSAGCGKINEANEMLARIQAECKKIDCQCG